MYIINIITYTCLLLFCLSSCETKQARKPFVIPDSRTLEKIEQRGTLHVCTYYNTTDYYVYKGVPKGFHYDLVKDFTDHFGIKLHIDVNPNVEDCLQELNEGKYDLVAMSLSVTEDRKKQINFTHPLFYTSKVLVQNKQRDSLVQHISDLKGKEIFIQEGTIYKHFLQGLNDSLHLNLKITEVEYLTYEDILLQIEKGELPFTVIDKNIAQIASRYMTRIDYSMELSEPEPVAWAVAGKAKYLLREINQWLDSVKKDKKFPVLYNRYYKNSYITSLHDSKYYKLKNGTISSFDSIIKKEAEKIGWDWRLLASVIYKESGFDPEATSNHGAVGLMQIMPETAIQIGFKNYTEPQDNIQAGACYLKYLEKMFTKYDLDSLNRIKFTLAAYNAGAGHVFDAMRLAESYGKKPNVWNNNVDDFIRYKSRPEIYRDSLSRNGYCDGKQTFDFVNTIIENYTHYKNTIPK